MIDLARAASVSVSTAKRRKSGELRPLSEGIRSLVRAAFEKAGVDVLDDGGGNVGIGIEASGTA